MALQRCSNLYKKKKKIRFQTVKTNPNYKGKKLSIAIEYFKGLERFNMSGKQTHHFQ